MTREEMLAMLGSTADTLARLLDGLGEGDLRWRPDPLEWSAKEIACHMRDFAEIDSGRLERMVAEDEPYLLDHNQDGLAQIRYYQGQDARVIPAEFARQRERTLVLLRSLDDAGWRRYAIHQLFGRLSLEQMAARMARHDREHLADLRVRRQSRGLSAE